MNEMSTNDEEILIDFSGFFSLFKKHLFLIIISCIICSGIALFYTTCFIDEQYSSTSSIYLSPKSEETGTVDYNAVVGNRNLVKDYMKILQSDTILSQVDKNLGLKEGLSKKYISTRAEDNSNIFYISAVTPDPELSQKIVSNAVDFFVKEVKEINAINNVLVLDQAKVSKEPISPSISKNTMKGFMVGAILSLGYVFTIFIFDKRIKNKKMAEEILRIPVLGEVPFSINK